MIDFGKMGTTTLVAVGLVGLGGTWVESLFVDGIIAGVGGVLVFVPAVLFVIIGLRWLVDPAGVAPEFGLVLGEGLGLSSQVGDMSGFFLTLGICMLAALVSGRRTWYYPPALLLFLTAIGRVNPSAPRRSAQSTRVDRCSDISMSGTA